MGEVIHGDYARWANDDVLHSVTNYELHKGLYSGHNDHNYFEIAHTIRREFDENGGIYKGRTLYSFADNHDVDRLASKLNNKAHMFPEYTLHLHAAGVFPPFIMVPSGALREEKKAATMIRSVRL